MSAELDRALAHLLAGGVVAAATESFFGLLADISNPSALEALFSLQVSSDHAVCVVLAAGGYPDTPRLGAVISGLDDAARIPGVQVFHAGTKLQDGQVVTAGGRVLGVTARGSTLGEAHARAYRAAELIQFEGRQFRRDIGARALGYR